MPGSRTTEAKLTVYFDGGCGLCSAEIAFYRRCRGSEHIEFVDVSSSSFVANDLSCEAALRRFHVRDARGRLVSGTAAFSELWTALPAWQRLGSLVGARLILPIAEVAYRAFLPVPPHLARAVSRISPHAPSRAAKVTSPRSRTEAVPEG